MMQFCKIGDSHICYDHNTGEYFHSIDNSDKLQVWTGKNRRQTEMFEFNETKEEITCHQFTAAFSLAVQKLSNDTPFF